MSTFIIGSIVIGLMAFSGYKAFKGRKTCSCGHDCGCCNSKCSNK